jgi:hypothetical protein
MGCPGRGQPLRGRLQRPKFQGKRKPDEPKVLAIHARHGTRSQGDAMPGCRVHERVSAAQRKLRPHRQPRLRRMDPPGGQVRAGGVGDGDDCPGQLAGGRGQPAARRVPCPAERAAGGLSQTGSGMTTVTLAWTPPPDAPVRASTGSKTHPAISSRRFPIGSAHIPSASCRPARATSTTSRRSGRATRPPVRQLSTRPHWWHHWPATTRRST